MSEAAFSDNALQQVQFPHKYPQKRLILMITTKQEITGLLRVLPPNNLSVSFLHIVLDRFNIKLKLFLRETTGQTLC